ncbi:MAG: methylcobamide--CoM methyltransferase [candidate division Zixibacteria bacterium]|nr:methylcobamide--CoM methyltransferase [candidate division Zixibacteria bacterium]
MLKTTVVGNYPKIAEDKSTPNLRSALNKFDEGKISDEELERVYQETIRRVIKEQEEAGVDLITDGQIRWDDMVTPFARNIDGFEIGGLIRFFDNNVYYRRPIIKSKLAFKNYSTVKEFTFLKRNSTKKIKAVMVGPFTLAEMSKDEYYNDINELTLDLAEILKKEAKKLEEAGAEFIQIDEPCLCFSPEKIDLVNRAVRIITDGLKVKTFLYLYFGGVEKLIPGLFDFQVNGVGIDVVSKPENLDLILDSSFSKELILGCLDARNTRLEEEEELLRLFEKITRRVSAERLYISPSCGMEFLPHETALIKLKRMVQSVEKFNRMGKC